MMKISTQKRAYKIMMQGARSITLAPSVVGAAKYISKDGLASDWKKVGGDMRKSMNKVARERAW